MLMKKQRTMEIYKKVGAEMRLMKCMGNVLYVDLAKILPKKEIRKLHKALEKIHELAYTAENQMRMDCDCFEGNFWEIFSGPLKADPINHLDAEIIEKAKEAVNELFKDA